MASYKESSRSLWIMLNILIRKPGPKGPGSDCQKSLAEFAATAANQIKIIFCRGVYLTENTSQAASVEFVCRRQTNYARSRLQKTVGKGQRPFRQAKNPGRKSGIFSYGHLAGGGKVIQILQIFKADLYGAHLLQKIHAFAAVIEYIQG